VQLGELLGAVDGARVEGPVDIDIRAIEHDSRRVVPGTFFCCIRGRTVDGHDLAAGAVAAGAVAVLAERAIDVPVTRVQVPDVRRAIGPLASVFWGEPSRQLAVVGVTGTNGKTTTTHIVQHILSSVGRSAAVIGTLTGARTTPEAPELQHHLAELRDGGTELVAMEVSSHAIAQHRVDGTHFRVAVFTNLSPEHLDFHDDMEEYFSTKASLFTRTFTDAAVICLDDEYGRRLSESIAVPWVGYSMDDVEDVELGARSSTFTWRGRRVTMPLGGRFNVANAIAASEIALLLGVDASEVADALGSVPPVPGRFEVIDEGQAPTVVVDYAHTPDGLEQVLRAARELTTTRVLVVFGCGGDRDRSKRPLMGQVASALADVVYVTSDNPRDEEVMSIIDEIMQGIPERSTVVVDPDRRSAIGAALAAARDGDVVVIAGKGHETTQVIGADELPFDDRAVARDELRALGGPT
jgi:UDP-N-acetylmuramoyl-L-alanyl-D-glutamate--2,6-diaminopimelate ligase